jgi:DNA-directed RNA polymerase specialized sigma24 family protein
MVDSEIIKHLVEKARGGDRSAFDTIVQMFSSRLKSRIASWSQFRIGPRMNVDEVIHETFIRAHRGIGGFQWQDDDALFRWLCGVAKNVLAESARAACKDARRAGVELDAGAIPVAGPSPSQVLRRGE